MKNNVVSKEYSIAATEILDILNYLPKDITSKIPAKLKDFFEIVSDKEYKPNFDYSRGLENVDMTAKTRALLAMIYRSYFCSDDEKKEFDEKLIKNEEQYQKELREKYNIDDIFKNNSSVAEEPNESQAQLVEYKEEKWYQKIFAKILKIFKK